MIKLNDPSHGIAICASVGITYNPTYDVVLSRVENGALYGGVVYQGYTGASIAIHMAGFHPRWINRDMLWVAFDYPFVKLGVKKLVGHVSSGNQKALELDLKLGFKEEARIADVYADGDLVFLSMYKSDCRWLGLKPPTPKVT